MTDTLRYRALSRALQRAKREPFLVRIDGSDPLEVRCDDVTFEGAATSLQLHLRVDPREFAGIFNAVQLATAPALAVAGNSPTFLGHRLWDETRVALFKQSVDVRDAEDKRRKRPPRVSFGTRWVRDGALELFAEAVDHYPVLLPVVGDDDPLECLEAGLIPGMEEIRLHQGTVWNWNRPVYDPAEGGHLRIEMRALPSGPSVPDMLANAAFLVGLALGLAPRATALCQEVSFEDARHSFYRAAQSGLEARLVWPRSLGGSETPVTARRLVPRLLPTARRGLASVGVASDEIDEHLGIIEERCATARTGAAWQREALSILGTRVARREALVAMLERYLEAAGSGSPVHRWPLPA